MTVTRRDWLASLGLASASTWLWSLGCGAPQRAATTTGVTDYGDVRSSLRDAVARLAAVHPYAHALAVARSRATASVDVIGAGVARTRRDGVVLVVRDAQGRVQERVTSELSAAGIDTAVRSLIGDSTKTKSLDLPAPPVMPVMAPIVDAALEVRAAELGRGEPLSSRIIYAATSIDVDETMVWSIGTSHDRQQQTVRIRERALRAAWNGTRPIIAEAVHGWRGGLAAGALAPAAIAAATESALALTTPGGFPDAVHAVRLAPDVAAALVDAGARTLLTAAARRRPEVAARFAATPAASPGLISLVDDPTDPTAYGGFAFDDEGVPAQPRPLIERGLTVGVLGEGRTRRPGHVGVSEAAPSHLRVTPGPVGGAPLADGFELIGATGAVVSPTSSRVIIGAARAKEYKAGSWTGRVFADVELVGELADLLAAVTGIGADSLVVPLRDEIDGEPRWRSVSTPAVVSRGLLRVRRSQS